MNTIPTHNLPIKSWAPFVEEGALAQARNLAALPFLQEWVALMPDVHQGYGMPIGGVIASDDVIIPNAVGVDIGCGMIAMPTGLKVLETDELKRIMGGIRERIPLGFNHQKDPQSWEGFLLAPDSPVVQRELGPARRQLGTLGGGNHFIEIQKGDDGQFWIMIHSGSRNIGKQTADYYHKKAQEACSLAGVDLPAKDLAYLPFDSAMGQEYYRAMKFCLDFAQANRDLMLTNVITAFEEEGLAVQTGRAPVNIHHNYASVEEHYGKVVLVHRKGAVFAGKGTPGIIPGSMGSASYITRGLGNPESFMSSSHGAGRAMGRGVAKKTLDLEAEKEEMDRLGIIHGLRTVADLDEAPSAYKNIDAVMATQTDLVESVVELRPVASIKG